MKVEKLLSGETKTYYSVDDSHEVVHDNTWNDMFCNTCNSTTCQHCTAVRVYLRHESRV